MSKKGDFLAGFSGGGNQKPLTEQQKAPVNEDKSNEKLKTDTEKDASAKVNVAENKKLADQIVAENEKKKNAPVGTPSRPAQSSSAIIKAPEHTVTKDDKFHKRKMIQYGVFGTVAIVVVVGIFLLVRMLNSVEVRDFTGDELRAANEWGILNSISIESTREYSLEFPENQIIRQSHEPGTNIARRSVLSVVVSDGPDMNEVVELPDFEEMTRAQIATWRTENGFTASSVAFSDEASSEVEANHVIRIEVPNDVDIDHFTRSNRLTIVFSTGPETVTMENFMGAQNNTRDAVESWATANPAINVEIVDEPSETVDRDIVLGQSHAPQREIDAGTTVTIRISVGLPIIVPNFAEILRDEIEDSIPEGLTMVLRDRINTAVPFGQFVSQSHEPGTELFGTDARVVVTYSAGRPWISQIGMENDIESTLFEINRKGAWITFGISYVDSSEQRGSVVYQSIYNSYVALDAHIVFHISRGNLTPPENAAPNVPDNGNSDTDSDNDGGE